MSVASYLKSSSKIVFVVPTTGYAGEIPANHLNSAEVLKILINATKNRESAERVTRRLKKLLDPLAIVKEVVGNIKLHQDKVSHNGVILRGVVVDKILAFEKEGNKQGMRQLASFLNKVMENPSAESREALFDWLERAGLIIDQDGDVLGYKKVTRDFKDCYTKTFDNSVGAVNKMPFASVDSNRNADCGSGFHIGTLDYASGFDEVNGPIVVCKINPKDVGSVPLDCNCQKMRVCEYKVIAVLNERVLLNQANYIADDEDLDDDDDYNDCECGDCDDCGYQDDDLDDDTFDLDEEDDDEEYCHQCDMVYADCPC